jgi:hypothetical protein
MATENVHNLAAYAVKPENAQFRRDASVKDQFTEALKNYPDVTKLTAADIAYCEGWLDLARLEFSDVPDILDKHLVVRVQAELYESASTRSG